MKNWNRPQIATMHSADINSQIKAAAQSWDDWCIGGDFR